MNFDFEAIEVSNADGAAGKFESEGALRVFDRTLWYGENDDVPDELCFGEGRFRCMSLNTAMLVESLLRIPLARVVP